MPHTWTNPPTWGPTDVPDEDDLNDLSENLRFLHTKDAVHAYQTTDETCLDSTWGPITWDAEDFDNASMHHTSVANSRLKCNSDGKYLVEFKVNWAIETAGIRRIKLRKNSGGSESGGIGIGEWSEDGIASEQTTVDGSRILVLDANDYVELFAWQNSGGPLDIKSGASVSYFQMIQLTG